MNFNHSLIIIRSKHGSFVRGRYVRNGEQTELTIFASVQPHFFKETDRLPEGREVTDAIKIYSRERLIPQDDKNETDTVKYNNKLYQVYQVKDYSQYGALPHYKTIALRFNEEQQEARQ